MNHPHQPMRDVTAAVREFYERYPYPPPVDSLDAYQRRWQDPRRRRADFHLHWPAKAYREDYTILVAGCGTSQAVRYAMRWPAAQVVGIDFSATSVRCTEELKRKYDLGNLQVRQLSIERVGGLGMNFDQIVCTGVLHHLSDPDAGLAALRDVLNPDGAMQLMVYAPYGRTGIYMLQDFCKRLGIQASDEGIQDLGTALQLLPPGHPLENLLRIAPDFRDAAALADALLHPQDRAYSVPQFLDFVQRAGLSFIRWLRQAPYSTRCGVLAQIPQTSLMKELSLFEQFELAELFRGTMVCHSAIICRNNGNGAGSAVSFAGDAWRSYVPIRLPNTICVQERLPSGKAGLLINQSHTCRDLILPVDSTQTLLLDAIDGRRSISGIVTNTISATPTAAQMEEARRFFEHLWWHDQVVYETANANLPKGSRHERRTDQT